MNAKEDHANYEPKIRVVLLKMDIFSLTTSTENLEFTSEHLFMNATRGANVVPIVLTESFKRVARYVDKSFEIR